jgi:protein-export membrane protein SecD
MNGKNTLLFFLIVAIIFGIAFIAVNGVTVGNLVIPPAEQAMNMGLDIKGGVVVVYEAQTDETGDELARTMDQTKQIIGNRVNELGLTEPIITLQGDKRIRIELPGVEDAEQAISVIGQTALLEFDLVSEGSVAYTGMDTSMFEYEQIFTGTNVKDSFVTQDQYGNPAVAMQFDDAGKVLFEEATRQALAGSKQIAIVLDGTVISAPSVTTVITNADPIIQGSFTYDEANNLSLLIRGGALPVELSEVQTSIVGPTLGLDSLNAAVRAAAIGLILVIIYMIGYYKIPGVIASIALVLYACIIVYTMIIMGATLTLPGVAGIVLSLGMAVDANVIIFERLKEEILVGKSLRASVNSGFHRAMSTIIDSNVTTFIAAVILFAFGEGPIKGFAITLMIGIIASMFTAVVVTRTLLNLSLGFTERKQMYGARG